MKRRLEVDKKYIDDLEALRTSATPQWSQSGVSLLVSPMLEFLAREVEERQATYRALSTYLEGMKKVKSPDRDKKTGGSMVSKYNELIAACEEHEVCREEASSTQAIKDMGRWHKQGPNGTSSEIVFHLSDTELSYFVLPETERNYRESIVRQQSLARVVNKWHHSQLPGVLDSHQSRSENIKALMVRMVSENSRLLTSLVGHLEATKNSVHEFSSSSFISWAHDRCDSESEHRYMKEAVHVNFSNGTTQPFVIFGSVSQTLSVVRRAIKALTNKREWMDNLGLTKPTKDKALELEQSLTKRPGIQLLLLSNSELRLLYSFALLSNPPLIPLDDEEIKRYADGIPRKNIHTIMSRVTRQDDITALFNIRSSYWFPYVLLTHRQV